MRSLTIEIICTSLLKGNIATNSNTAITPSGNSFCTSTRLSTVFKKQVEVPFSKTGITYDA